MKKNKFKQLLSLSLSASFLIGGFGTVAVAQTNSSNNNEETESIVTNEQNLSPLAESLNTAMELFTEEFPDAELTDIDIDLTKDGYYDIQLTGQDSEHQYELDYNTQKEEVTDRETERENDKDRVLPLEDLLSLDEINEIALTEAGFGEITEWNLDWDDDDNDQKPLYWDITVEDKDAKREAELEIEALTGEILSVEFDD